MIQLTEESGSLKIGSVRKLRTNLLTLIAQKAQRERRRITPRTVATELTITPATIYRMVNGTLREYPTEVIEKLCAYFGCEVGELLVLEEEPSSPGDDAQV